MSDTGRYNFAAFTAKVIERCRELWPDGEISVEGHTVTVMRPNAGETEWREIRLSIGRAYREYWASGDITDVLDKLFSMLTNPPITRAEIEQRAMIKFDHFKINQDRSRVHWPFPANPQGVIITAVLDYAGNMHFFEEEADGRQFELEKHVHAAAPTVSGRTRNLGGGQRQRVRLGGAAVPRYHRQLVAAGAAGHVDRRHPRPRYADHRPAGYTARAAGQRNGQRPRQRPVPVRLYDLHHRQGPDREYMGNDERGRDAAAREGAAPHDAQARREA